MKYLPLIGKRIENKIACPAILFFMMLSLLCANTIFAQGDLLLYPKRIVFDGSKKTQDLNLANSGKDTARYILSVVQIRMKEDGSFETITEPDPGQNFADKYFRIFPRSVVLPPNEAQTVKIQLSNKGELQPGEYRSHLYIRAEPEKKPLGDESAVNEEKGIEVKLVAVFGISIPVIIRAGENSASVNISDVSFEEVNDTIPTVKFTFNRSGNMSVYGDVSVDYISPEGKTQHVGVVNGLAVYTPTTRRYVKINLAKLPGVNYQKGSLHVTYSYDASRKENVAEQSIVLR